MKQNKSLIYSIFFALVLFIGLFFYLLPKQDNVDKFKTFDPYKGLVTQKDIQMDAALKEAFLQEIGILQASVKEKRESGEKVDLNLYGTIASKAYDIGDLVLARESLEIILERNQINFSAWNNYGNVLKSMGDYDGAREAYLQAVKTSNGTVEEYVRDFVELLEDYFPEEDELAKEYLLFGVEHKGQTPWFMVKLAEWYLEHEDCDRALAHYDVATRLAPESGAIKKDFQAAKITCVLKAQNK